MHRKIRKILFIGLLMLGLQVFVSTPNIVLAASGDILINEVEYDTTQSGNDNKYEWLELYNTTGNSIDITGWTLTEQTTTATNTYAFSSGTIAAGELFVIANNTPDFQVNYPTVTPDLNLPNTSTLKLANGGDFLELKDQNGNLVDRVAWESENPTLEAIAGKSICRNNLNGNALEGDCDPTPGKINKEPPLTPFDASSCAPDGSLYFNQNNPTTLEIINTDNNPFTFSPVGSGDGSDGNAWYNAIGYNQVDHYIYGVAFKSNELVRIGSDATVENLGVISMDTGGDLPLPSAIPGNFIAGDVSPDGKYYFSRGGPNATDGLYVVDLNVTPYTATEIPYVDAGGNSKYVWVGDLVYSTDNLLWGMNRDENGDIRLVSIDPTTGVVTDAPNTVEYNAGMMYGDAFGNLYGAAGGVFFQIEKDTGLQYIISEVPVAKQNDGAGCQSVEIKFPVDVVVTKTNNQDTYTPGQTVEYHIEVINIGAFDVNTIAAFDTLPSGIDPSTVEYTIVVENGASSSEDTSITHTGTINDSIYVPHQYVDATSGETVTPKVKYALTFTIPEDYTGELINTAGVTLPENFEDIDESNNTVIDTDQPKPGSISGTLTDQAGKPIAGSTIALQDADGNPVVDGDGEVIAVTTDANGNYSFTNVPPGDYTVTQTDVEGYTSEVNELSVTVEAGKENIDNDFVDEQLGSISGTLTDQDENPISGSTIALQDADGNPVVDGDGEEIAVTTDVNGNYSFTNIVPGDYTIIQTDLPEYISEENELAVTVEAGKESTDNDFVDEKLGSISGTLTDQDGNTLSGSTITLTDSEGKPVLDSKGNAITTITDAVGNYSFENIIAGDYTVTQTDLDGYTSEVNELSVTVEAGKESADNNFVDTYEGEEPILTATGATIYVGENLTILDLVISASDLEDKDLKDEVELKDNGGFDENIPGEYTVIFTVTDSDGNTVEAEVLVIVKEKAILGGGKGVDIYTPPVTPGIEPDDTPEIPLVDEEPQESDDISEAPSIDNKPQEPDTEDVTDSEEDNIKNEDMISEKELIESSEPAPVKEEKEEKVTDLSESLSDIRVYPKELPKTGASLENNNFSIVDFFLKIIQLL